MIRIMTKITHGLGHLPYKDSLKHINLHFLQRRKMQGNLMEVFKWVKWFNSGDRSMVLTANKQGRTHGNVFKLNIVLTMR